MKFKMDRYFPAGYDPSTEWKWALAGWILSIFWSMRFLINYADTIRTMHLAEEQGKRTSFVLMTFPRCIENCFIGFTIVIAFLLLVIVFHYRWHYNGSRSIYLMRRLPDRFELARRCLAFPVAAIIICLLTMVLLYFIYRTIYIYCTPERFFAGAYDGTVHSYLRGGF